MPYTSQIILALFLTQSSSLRLRAEVKELNEAVTQSFESFRPSLEIPKPS
jgi:hypothetical protein